MSDTGEGATEWRREVGFGFFETDPAGRVRPDALFDALQAAAGRHADSLGIGAAALAREGAGWFLGRLYLVQARPLVADEPLELVTWCAAVDKAVATRAFEVSDAKGLILLRATSNWGVFETRTRQSVADLDRRLAGVPVAKRSSLAFPTRVVPALPKGTHDNPMGQGVLGAPALTRHADLDVNGHVNNARLVGMLVEPALIEDPAASLVEFDVQFRAEAGPVEALLSRFGPPDEQGRRLHSLLQVSDGRELVRAASVWRPGKPN